MKIPFPFLFQKVRNQVEGRLTFRHVDKFSTAIYSWAGGHGTSTLHSPFCGLAVYFLVTPNNDIFNVGFFSSMRNDVAIVSRNHTLAAMSFRWHNIT
jgi:hypothetical protein